jgi:hypothetical protein
MHKHDGAGIATRTPRPTAENRVDLLIPRAVAFNSRYKRRQPIEGLPEFFGP